MTVVRTTEVKESVVSISSDSFGKEGTVTTSEVAEAGRRQETARQKAGHSLVMPRKN